MEGACCQARRGGCAACARAAARARTPTHHPPLACSPQLPELEEEPGEAALPASALEGEFDWVREYNSTVRYDNAGQTYVFRFAPGGVTYAELGTRLSLRKRKRQAATLQDEDEFLQVGGWVGAGWRAGVCRVCAGGARACVSASARPPCGPPRPSPLPGPAA